MSEAGKKESQVRSRSIRDRVREKDEMISSRSEEVVGV